MPYMIIALVTLPNHVAANAAMTLPFPRAARKLPRATTVSAGIGGKTVSISAAAGGGTDSVPIGSDVRHARSGYTGHRSGALGTKVAAAEQAMPLPPALQPHP